MIITLLLSLFISSCAPAGSQPAEAVAVSFVESTSPTELHTGLRALWTGHVFWVRSVVMASHYQDKAGAKAAEDKVVENARAIADAIDPLYGKEAADQLFGLLAAHYGAAKKYMVARFEKGGSGTEAASKELNENAKAIAIFLSTANPHLPEATLHSLLLAHGGHHLQQIDAVNRGDFATEAQLWDAMLGHIYAISDALADALIKQFPDKIAG